MRLPLAYYGDAVLRKKGTLVENIDGEIKQLVEDMIDTMIVAKGTGIAAPQVHRSLALFLVYFFREDEKEIDRARVRVFINPRIISYSEDTTTYKEGCLSIPKIYRDVTRPLTVKVTALDIDGKEFTEEFHDFEAHIVLHENDHINGVLFIDRLSNKDKKDIEPQLREIKKKFSKKIA